jgi:DNA topoisomerase-3
MKLIIAEKPSAARDIAGVIGATDRTDTHLEGNGYVVTWCVGHLASLAPPASYNPDYERWSIDDLPILPNAFKHTIPDELSDRWDVLESFLTDSSFNSVINACDAGREGQLIFHRVYDLSSSSLPIQRLWLNDLTEQGVRRAFDELSSSTDFESLTEAARCRARADWLIGINGTRALTLTANGRHTLSVGRVQTPTLALIVQRDDKVESFTPTPFWRLHATFHPPNDKRAHFSATYQDDDTDRIWDQSEAEGRKTDIEDAASFVDLSDAGPATVTSCSTKETNSFPPSLFDLTGLQRTMNSKHGWTSEHTLSVAQELYEHGYITYPRTDSSALPSTIQQTLDERVSPQLDFSWANLPDGADTEHFARHIDDDSVSDHHAIIPTTTTPDLSELSDESTTLYATISKRFLASFCPPATFKNMTLAVEIAGHSFEANSRAKLTPGWHTIESPDSSDDLPDSLPSLSAGDSLEVNDIHLDESQTRPPDPFNENSLLQTMETCGEDIDDPELRDRLGDDLGGLGTPATRANIIEKLLSRNYIQRDGSHLRSTQLGRDLIYSLPDTLLSSPEMTARWEAALEWIQQEKLDPSSFMTRVKDRAVEFLNDLRSADIVLPSLSNDALGTCPDCDAPVFQYDEIYTCDSGRECPFIISRTILDREIPPSAVQSLLDGDTTDKLKGFTSQNGNSFAARLAYEDGEIDFLTDY